MNVIEVRGVGKEYRLGTVNRATFARDLRKWIGLKASTKAALMEERVWAVQDVSFDVQAGQAMGLIGKNGAGKSTLLKILSRVTAPTTGSIRAKGRIASLLEVGTGFHPELTGRENIFLNGAILGMTKSEIKRKLDEIIAFSGVEKYVDTPVKRYSSGMYVRLAFAVAAHLESEILVMDEVLAVGDAEFQKKCLGKMDSVARNEGRTVLFVSHNMAAVSQLCQRAVMLVKGKLHANGSVNEVVNEYLKYNTQQQSAVGFSDATIIKSARLVDVREIKDSLQPGQMIDLEFELDSPGNEPLSLDIFLKYRDSVIASLSSAYHSDLEIGLGQQTIKLTLGPINLCMGRFEIDLSLAVPKQRELENYQNVIVFDIDKQPVSNFYHAQLEAGNRFGYLVPPQQWHSTAASIAVQ